MNTPPCTGAERRYALKRFFVIILCLLLLQLPVCADEAAAEITTYHAVCTVSETAECDVNLTLSVAFPNDVTSFMIPLPPEADQIVTPGLQNKQEVSENCIFLIIDKEGGFSSTDTVNVSYHLPQIAESWDGTQTMTLPLLNEDWNCQIDYCNIQIVLPKENNKKPSVVDIDGDPLKNYLSVTSEDITVTLESKKNIRPKTASLVIEFDDGFFTLPDAGDSDIDSDTTRINSIVADCTVQKDSSCLVAMSAEYTFAGAVPSVMIPVPKDAYDISVGAMQCAVGGNAECKVLIFNSPSGFMGTQSFDISYRLLTTAVKGDGEQLFTLPVIFPAWQYSIRSLSLTVTMPSEFPGLPEFYSSYYNDQIGNYLNTEVSEGVIRSQSLEPLMEQESLTVKLTLPDGYFDLRFMRGRFAKADVLLFWILALCCAAYWFLFLRNRIRKVKPEASAPLGCNAGQIPYLLQLKQPSLGLMSTTWASLGYLSVERTKDRKQYLLCRMDMGNERSRCEAKLFATLFSRSGECRVHSPAFQSAEAACEALTQDDWQSRLYSRKSRFGRPLILCLLGAAAGAFAALLTFDNLLTPQSFRWLLIIPLAVLFTLASVFVQKLAETYVSRSLPLKRYAIFAVMALMLLLSFFAGCFGIMLVNCILQVLIGAVCLPGARRTAGGMNIFYQLLGLRKYLRKLDPVTLDGLLESDPQYFYRMLPYAEALGVGRKFAKKCSGFPMEPCHWLDWKGQAVDEADAFYAKFSILLDVMLPVRKKKKLFFLK